MIDRSDPYWYKDAIIYQLHVKAFFDANNDGIGDFEGLIRKLDYVQELGVTAIWLLPFYPSPLRDDGYDIADYRNVNAAYGRMQDFKRLVREAHRRGLRVITELVINHTSEQHPWFQRARAARPGTVTRNFYVWSDTDQKYLDTRIIFIDTESSNWAWDPVAQAYYWHRFYSHQPDLNFDNPRVLREIVNVLHYWLDIGVDGLRLDAVPYLCEREGTNNENLPETHAILRHIRAEVDAHYPDRMLLAEANQWPEDTQEYFGDGDECHMAFHFPLMPRMYMAIAQEDRHPVTDIMRQTPEIPDSCQWGVFLRNHDELTLEMVTDEERDYLWNFYAADRRMRINLGIRRRLAPLLDRDRRKIELMHGLLLSMPGTPILYYGDEIGMGDNIYLGDRDGVRTPMQWSPDRNGGFSLADPARLYLPPLMDPLYGYGSVNVEAQQRDASSLLNWVRRLVATRKAHRAFGRGNLRFLYPGNRRILAFLREVEGEVILCVANLARTAQAVELELSEFRDRIPVELTGRTPFPPIGDLTYLLTIGPYEFYWFVLSTEAELPRWHATTPPALPEFTTLVLRDDDWSGLLENSARVCLEREVLPTFLPNHRWYAGKDVPIERTRITGIAEIGASSERLLLSQVEVQRQDNTIQRYQLPLTVTWDPAAVRHESPLVPFTLAKVRRFRSIGALHDAVASEALPRTFLAAIRRGETVPANGGEIVFSPGRLLADIEWPEEIGVRRFGTEQSNSSLVLADRAVLKLYRRLVSGPHPEVEIGHFLTEVTGFRNTPPLLGTVLYRDGDGTETALAVLQGLVFNQGDGWSYTTDYLDRYLEHTFVLGGPQALTLEDEEQHAPFLTLAALLGQRTAELHRAFAVETNDPAFRVEETRKSDVAGWRRSARAQMEAAFRALRRITGNLEGDVAQLARDILGRRKECLAHVDSLMSAPPHAMRSRLHGDYHLGQVLLVENDFHILDFEGEPARPLSERRAKTSPLKDVAGMLRSFDYAAHSAARSIEARVPDSYAAIRTEALAWRDAVTAAFMTSYQRVISGAPTWPEDLEEADRLTELFLLEKVFYEICYEAANRPAWLDIPLRGALDLLNRENTPAWSPQ